MLPLRNLISPANVACVLPYSIMLPPVAVFVLPDKFKNPAVSNFLMDVWASLIVISPVVILSVDVIAPVTFNVPPSAVIVEPLIDKSSNTKFTQAEPLYDLIDPSVVLIHTSPVFGEPGSVEPWYIAVPCLPIV